MSPPRHEPSFSPRRSKKGNSFLRPAAFCGNVVSCPHVTSCDVIQALLTVTPAGKPEGLGAQTVSMESIQSNAPQSNTIWTSAVERACVAGVTLITNTFAGFVPGSLAEAVWAGFHTDGRSTRIWEFWQLPPGGRPNRRCCGGIPTS